MIRVDNSAEKRIFASLNNSSINNLKKEVIEKLEDIESSSVRDYNDLSVFESYTNADSISIFKFKKLICKEITNLLRSKIDDNFKAELRTLRDDIYLILSADFGTMKNYLKDKVDSNSLLIYQENKKLRSSDYKKYHKKFETLYSKYLSNVKSDFKKPFFELFNDVNVCPYCNRNFINPIHKDEITKLHGANDNQSPDIEHFFPKSIYPFLSLSISNLLPSCAFCNKIKSDVDTYTQNCISPYEMKENDDRFRFEFDSIDTDTRKINLKCSDTIKNSEVLHLDNLYNEIHSDYVNEMFTKHQKYPDVNKKFLKNTFDLSEDEYQKHFCNYYKEEEFNKHPLSKMTKDLYKHIKEYGK
ncbi:MAG: hypothetical protein K8R39_03420 [Arcobacteraceae bacterium]|nr:hypothetical protein [Arcobacteraceae bacterium]